MPETSERRLTVRQALEALYRFSPETVVEGWCGHTEEPEPGRLRFVAVADCPLHAARKAEAV
jgi:hypothetical protein